MGSDAHWQLEQRPALGPAPRTELEAAWADFFGPGLDRLRIALSTAGIPGQGKNSGHQKIVDSARPLAIASFSEPAPPAQIQARSGKSRKEKKENKRDRRGSDRKEKKRKRSERAERSGSDKEVGEPQPSPPVEAPGIESDSSSQDI